MPEPAPPSRGAITIRSILFSLLGIFLMSALAGQHDNVCRAGPLMIGNHLPGGALAYLVFVGLVWNGLAGRLSRRLALSPGRLPTGRRRSRSLTRPLSVRRRHAGLGTAD